MAAAVVVALVLGLRAGDDPGAGTAGGEAGGAAARPVELQVGSVDPSGGTGFREEGGGWVTQTYRSATFGNLKPGVGLLLDAGAERRLTRVRFTAADGPFTVELRAGGSADGDPEAFDRAAGPAQADGATTLDVRDGGSHRYWLLWVTELGSADGGYRAGISDVTADAAG